ncbi:type II RES/Xre toxin-antitoxin system antitoxin [Salisaeta longa]|uniref:type II RES/Xre toxin-antitoxin system antitoxin n=1 Tax=Salisaeta longa TaxID=503170 RepID=UPI0003B454FF|nr:antitoxin Xre/MbcA/ParS toxin-binding domain-containing protein [Salisaeta longa]
MKCSAATTSAALHDALAPDAPPTEAIAIIREGVSTDALQRLKEALALTDAALARVVRIPKRTLTRRRREGTLRPDESERVIRLLQLIRHATSVFGSTEDARTWMHEPNVALGDETPLQFADTEPGARRVDQLLGQIAHGVAL